jgi:hypothetical protein
LPLSRPSRGERIHPAIVMAPAVQNTFDDVVPDAIRRAEPLYIEPFKVGPMGSYVLYLLTQAFVALIFAYFSGTLLFSQRRLHMLLVCAGFYLLMGSALMEVWGDRAGWTAWAIGANAAMVATGVASFGAGALLREADQMEDRELIVNVAKVFIGISVIVGVALATSGGTSEAIVDLGPGAGASISGTFSHLGPVGWALGSPVFIGALLMSWLGVRSIITRKDIKGAWLPGAGVLFLLWPFDVWFHDLPLSPAIILMATAMTYFGFKLPSEGEDGVDGEGNKDKEREDGDPEEDGLAPWVREAIAARQAKRTIDPDEGQNEEPDEGTDVVTDEGQNEGPDDGEENGDGDGGPDDGSTSEDPLGE